uniref:Binding-protein-dependent transport systems inner membrane component n=1 Tax=Chelativorans sp. (strain BNC1) TaxID=266779 RepID=Q11F99_CHESB
MGAPHFRAVRFPKALKERAVFPKSLEFSISQPINDFVAFLIESYGETFRAISNFILSGLLQIEWVLRALPWWGTILIFMAVAYLCVRNYKLPLLVGGLLMLAGMLGLWDLTMQTLALMLMATLISCLVGIPTGVLVAKVRVMRNILIPMLDIMQTMPSFVYLIPAIMLFGLGKVPAVLATIIYGVPPLIRLTSLGIRQVDQEVVEAALAFGSSSRQILFGVELPLAVPTILAGLNQTIMMSLSMVVVSSMIGARGLGQQVLEGIQTLDVGKGLEAGVGIVILAVVLDRITQGLGQSQRRD